MMDSVEHMIRYYDVIGDTICATQWLDDARYKSGNQLSWPGRGRGTSCGSFYIHH